MVFGEFYWVSLADVQKVHMVLKSKLWFGTHVACPLTDFLSGGGGVEGFPGLAGIRGYSWLCA